MSFVCQRMGNVSNFLHCSLPSYGRWPFVRCVESHGRVSSRLKRPIAVHKIDRAWNWRSLQLHNARDSIAIRCHKNCKYWKWLRGQCRQRSLMQDGRRPWQLCATHRHHRSRGMHVVLFITSPYNITCVAYIHLIAFINKNEHENEFVKRARASSTLTYPQAVLSMHTHTHNTQTHSPRIRYNVQCMSVFAFVLFRDTFFSTLIGNYTVLCRVCVCVRSVFDASQRVIRAHKLKAKRNHFNWSVNYIAHRIAWRTKWRRVNEKVSVSFPFFLCCRRCCRSCECVQKQLDLQRSPR